MMGTECGHGENGATFEHLMTFYFCAELKHFPTIGRECVAQAESVVTIILGRGQLLVRMP